MATRAGAGLVATGAADAWIAAITQAARKGKFQAALAPRFVSEGFNRVHFPSTPREWAPNPMALPTMQKALNLH